MEKNKLIFLRGTVQEIFVPLISNCNSFLIKI